MWMSRSAVGQSDEVFSQVKRSYDIAVARATADFGWNARQLFQEQTTDFHWITRELRWRRFCIGVRDQMVAAIAQVFAQAGKAFGENPRLIINGLPSLADVDEAESKLMAGGTEFCILLKPFSSQLE